ncbi:MAG: polysaccharide biosynthesis protein [Thermoanaerobacteraceae bacterium]|nr:polysaccharide biosynthesis protein [Thermoanaerobacteraceae bacterium]
MRHGFVRGAAILAAAGFISKLMGALYRIPFARLVGGEGVGLYQMAYPLYTVVLALSTAGIPVAISILVSEKLAVGDRYGARRVFKVSLAMLAGAGAFFSLLLAASAKTLAYHVLSEPRAAAPITAIAPAIFVTSIVSALRGYFQGYQVMHPTAISQVLEQLVRVTTVFFAVFIFLPRSITLVAAGATFGAVTGSAAALVFLVWYLFAMHRTNKVSRVPVFPQERKRELVMRIGTIALPLSLGNLVMPISQMIDALVVPQRLRIAGFAATRATELFGEFTGMAGSLINLPTIVTVSLAVSLVPAISQALAKGNTAVVSRRINAALRISIILMLPAAAGLWALAEPIALLLYDIREVGIPLAYLSWGVFFLGLYQMTSGALQGLGKTYIPVINLFLASAAKFFLSYWWTAVPWLAIRGAALATVFGFAMAFLLNYLALKILVTGVHFKCFLLRPLPAVAVMAVSVIAAYKWLDLIFGNTVATLASVGLGAVIYVLVLGLFGVFRVQDLHDLPFVGHKLIRLLVKLGIAR